MSAETVADAHAFTDEISALMQRLKGHLRDGRLDVLTVMEIMELIGGLPKTGPFALFGLACSTDETLTAALFVERLHRQSERLAREVINSDSSTDDTDEDTVKGGGGHAASVKKGGSHKELKEKERPREPYWQGQQGRPTHQPANIPYRDPNKDDCDETEDLKHSRGNDKGRGRGRGQGRGYKRSNRQYRRDNSAMLLNIYMTIMKKWVSFSKFEIEL